MRYVQSGYGKKNFQPRKHGWFSYWRRPQITRKKLYRSREEVTWRTSTFKKESAPLRKLRLALTSLLLLFLIWIGVLLYLPYFHVTTVSYSGLRVTKAKEMKELVEGNLLKGSAYYIPRSSYFILNEESIAKQIKNSFALNDVTVTKIFPNTLEVVIEEKISSIIYDNGTKYYLLDQSGTVQRFLKDVDPSENEVSVLLATSSTTQVSSTTSALALLLTGTSTVLSTPAADTTFIHTPNYATIRREYGGYPLIYDNTKPNIVSDQTDVLSAKKIAGIIEMYNRIENSGLARIRYLEVGDPGAGAIIHSNQPWKIYFEPNDDIQSQYDHIKVILKDTKPKEKIDVRYGDRVFVK